MAATTITRESMTDGVTAWTVTRIGSAIYDRIDTVLGANITFGGTVSAEGFGTHAISTGGTGTNRWQIRNTTSGTANRASFDVGNNSDANLGRLIALSSAHTPSSYLLASGVVLEANGAGGLSIACTDAAGDLRLYTNSTLRLTLSDAGVLTPSSTTMVCGFLAYNSADDTGVTDTSAIDFDTEVYDEGGHFSGDTFTAPITGRYYLSASVHVTNATGGALTMGAYFLTTAATGGIWFGTETSVPASGERIFSGSAIVNMTATDTATVRYSGSGNATINGDSSGGGGGGGPIISTFFAGRLVL